MSPLVLQEMGKKNKKSLNQPEENVIAKEQLDEPQDPADDDALIPYHTKQASFAMLYLLFFSFLMFTLPFGAFYGVRHVLQVHFQIDGFTNNCWSVLSAVVTVNVVIGLYALFGFIEAKKEERTVQELASTKEKTN